MANTKLTAYNLLVNFAYSVIPSGGGPTGKAPLIAWEQYQHIMPEPEDIQAWDQQFKPSLWGIVTGTISCIVIIDIDKPELRTLFDEAGLSPHIQTPRGGFHYWFRHPGHPVKTVAGLLPGVDVRGDGGFVNVLGKRKDGEYIVLIPPEPNKIYPWDKIPAKIAEALNGQRPVPPPIEGAPITEGQRNATLTRLAGSLRAKGLSQEAIEAALQGINTKSCNPPLPGSEVSNIARSIARYPADGATGSNITSRTCPTEADSATESHKKVTERVTKAGEIREWVTETSGWFSYVDIDREFEVRSAQEKHNRWMILKRLRDDGFIESHPRDNKLFRYVKVAVRLIDFRAAGMKQPLGVRYPFGLESYFDTYPGNIIVIAGAADAGKTAFLLNFIRLNMADFTIYYQSSEMGDAELANRLSKFQGIALQDWNFTPEERSRDFADVIRQDCINIVDYLELAGDFYMVADYLKQIHDKLRSGIAIVALQKKRNVELGRGGDFGLEKPRLYLSMDPGKLTIQKAKNWANPAVNPRGLMVEFKLVSGCDFIVEKNWHRPVEDAKR